LLIEVIPNLGYEPAHLGVREKNLNNGGKIPLFDYLFTVTTYQFEGHAVAQLVEALCYKPEGRGFDSRRHHWNLSIHNPSGRTMALGLT
jgi:hypothetical protein